MDALSLITMLAFIGFVIFGALCIVAIVKTIKIAYKTKKNGIVANDNWPLSSKKEFAYYILFLFFSFAYRILKDV